MAHVIHYPPNVTLGADKRCDRCGAQAYLGIEIVANPEDLHTTELLLCAHHFGQHEEALLARDVTIHDHRPALFDQEQGARDAASAAQ